MNIGIIGFGRLGHLISNYLKKDFTILIYDIKNINDKIKDTESLRSASLTEICQCPIIIPSVPISQFKDTIQKISPLLKKSHLSPIIIDVCSVKEYPVNIMQELLPKTTQIIATHPMFGPDSIHNKNFEKKITIYPINIKNNQYKRICTYLKSLNLKIIECSPAYHDKQIAKSLVLTHFIGRGLLKINAHPLKIETQGYQKLLKILETVKNDSWQLFEDMNIYNKYAKKEIQAFSNSLQDIISKLN